MVEEYTNEYNTFMRDSQDFSEKYKAADKRILSSIKSGTMSEEQIQQEIATLRA